MIDTIKEEAGISGAKDEHLPYPNTTQQPEPLSKHDCAKTDEEKFKSARYPYRRVVGQLMYGMVHTMVSILYALYSHAMETTQANVTSPSSNIFFAMSSIARRTD